ncbi:MAG TPA: tripartite tricarboxylate transporter TctB family protein [Paenirhodobacter sp.]
MGNRPAPVIRVATRPLRIGTGLVMLAVAAGALAEAARLQGLPGTTSIGPGAFPGLVAIVLGIAALILLSGRGDKDAEPLRIEHANRVLLGAAAIVLFVLAMAFLPILGAIAAFTCGFQWLMGERRARLLIGGSLGLTAAIWVAFGLLLNTPI